MSKWLRRRLITGFFVTVPLAVSVIVLVWMVQRMDSMTSGLSERIIGRYVPGLGILATEFDWARRLLAYAKERYDKAMDWFHDQHIAIQVLGGIFTALIVAATLWLLGALDWTAEFIGIDWPWLNSPIGIGS